MKKLGFSGILYRDATFHTFLQGFLHFGNFNFKYKFSHVTAISAF